MMGFFNLESTNRVRIELKWGERVWRGTCKGKFEQGIKFWTDWQWEGLKVTTQSPLLLLKNKAD